VPRITAKKKKELHRLFAAYKKSAGADVSTELRLFSNREEDGIILHLIAALDIKSGYFLDIGSNDCINSNCANLAFNFDWGGTFIDADKKLLEIGKRNYKLFGKQNRLRFVTSLLTPDNINEVVGNNIVTREIDFMNIDIDGNDYLLWESLDVVKPKIVVIENKIEYGRHDIVVPASSAFPTDEWGASIVSMTKLAETKGYTLIATNRDGFNAFYINNDYLKQSFLRPLSIEMVLKKSNIRESFYSDEVIKELMRRVSLFHEVKGIG
jgi:hypothetical protein